jgi:glycosyltransferase involved in cell wall biosynthesis
VKLLFVHQNFPGQYKHMARIIAADPNNRVVAICDKISIPRHEVIPGINYLTYESPRVASTATHHYVRHMENSVRRGQAVFRVAATLRQEGFIPDVICVNPGWGEALYLKDIFPESKVLGLFEYFYAGIGRDVGFDPEFPVTIDMRTKVRTKNAVNLLSLDACDWRVTPTRWQHSTFPEEYQNNMSVVFDGVDTNVLVPNKDVSFKIPDKNLELTANQEIITFVNRNLEPLRGYHMFMRSIPAILEQRPDAYILIVGGDGVSYGRRPEHAGGYKQQYLDEIKDKVDTARVIFLNLIPYAKFVSLLQLSSVHVYLTYPFVLSWSMIEAMSAGCLVVGSKTPPVEEVIEDGVNGLLVDFFSTEEICNAVNRVLDHPDRMADLRQAARQTIVSKYDLATICLPQHIELINTLAQGKRPLTGK